MGIFDNLFGLFTGDSQINATGQQRNYIDTLRTEMRNLAGTAETRAGGAIDLGLEGGLASLQPFYNTPLGGGSAYDNFREYGTEAHELLNRATDRGIDALQPLGAAAGRYGDIARSSGDMYANALGLNGPGGNAIAEGAFQTSPGFQFMLDTGLESILRNANAAGMAAGGNQLQESQRYGTGLAQQEYGSWLNRLGQREGQFAPLEAQTLGQFTGGEANLYNTLGRAQADTRMGVGNRITDAQNQAARLAATLQMQGGQSLANLTQALTGQEFDLARASINPYTSTFMNQANAQGQAGQNVLGGIGGLLSAIF